MYAHNAAVQSSRPFNAVFATFSIFNFSAFAVFFFFIYIFCPIFAFSSSIRFTFTCASFSVQHAAPACLLPRQRGNNGQAKIAKVERKPPYWLLFVFLSTRFTSAFFNTHIFIIHITIRCTHSRYLPASAFCSGNALCFIACCAGRHFPLTPPHNINLR